MEKDTLLPNNFSYCSLFSLVLWTGIYSYLIQKLIQMLNIVTREQRHDGSG